MRLWVAAVLLVSACQVGLEQSGIKAGSGPVPVKTRTVEATDLPVEVSAVGTLLADETVEVRPEMAGQVVDVSFEDGDAVHAGDVLAKLRDAAPKAALAEAEANLTLATAQLVRASSLFARANASAEEVDRATAERDLAQSRRDAAADTVRRTVIRAPFAGRVSARLIAVGAQVDPSTVVTTLIDADPLQVEVDLPESVQPWLSKDSVLTLRTDGITPTPATISYVAPTVDPETRTVRVRADLPKDSTLAPGLTVQATVQIHPPTAVIAVPAESVTTRADGPMVWVVSDGKVSVRKVTTGARLASQVTVTSGLTPGETIVVEGLVRLREGVEVAESKPAPAAGTEAPAPAPAP